MAVSMTMPILIVDDYNTMIRITRNLLRQLGFSNIDEACDGRTALAKLRAKDYALVISDWSMDSMSGIELLRRVRADERTKATPFIMVANDNEEGAQAQCRGGRVQLYRQAVQRAGAEIEIGPDFRKLLTERRRKSHGSLPAVDDNGLPGGERSRWRGQIHRHAGDFIWLADAPQARMGGVVFQYIRIIP